MRRASSAAAPATRAPRQGPRTITAARSTPEATRKTPGPSGSRTRALSGSSSNSAASAAAPNSASAVRGRSTASSAPAAAAPRPAAIVAKARTEYRTVVYRNEMP